MGISPEWIDLFIQQAKKFDIGRDDAILDIGAQEFFCKSRPGAINDFLFAFGGVPYSEHELKQICDSGTYTMNTFLRAGFRYAAIDIQKLDHVLHLDLERDQLPSSHQGRYKFVNNAGTTEHIINQLNAFRIIHEATILGGLMFHGVPMADYRHGMISYSPKFFWSLATANKYDIVLFNGHAAEQFEPLESSFTEQIHFKGKPQQQKLRFTILLQKIRDTPFVGPRDPAFQQTN